MENVFLLAPYQILKMGLGVNGHHGLNVQGLVVLVRQARLELVTTRCRKTVEVTASVRESAIRPVTLKYVNLFRMK